MHIMQVWTQDCFDDTMPYLCLSDSQNHERFTEQIKNGFLEGMWLGNLRINQPTN